MSEQALAKVLIVDDSRMVRASIIKHIRGRFEFREESDGEAAWQALVVDPSIELVMSDISMPNLDGYGLLERIRTSKISRLQHMPVVIISGDEDDAAREKARQLGADDFITKGIGTTELLARLDSMSRLARTRRELEESRAALARQQNSETDSGFMTDSVLNWHGGQESLHGRSSVGGISALVIEIDHFDNIAKRHGQKVAELVARKLSRILTAKVRQDDTVAQLSAGQFAVLSPHTDVLGCCAFALRLQKAIRKLVMTYREERIRISITAGVASSLVDGMSSVSHLVGIAVQRVELGKKQGGACVVCDQGEVDEKWVEQKLKSMVSIDPMLMRLKMGDSTDLRARMPDVVAALLPLLEVMEAELQCGIPLEALARVSQTAAEGTSA